MQKVTRKSTPMTNDQIKSPENATTETTQSLSDFWSVPQEELLHRLRSTPQGLSAEEARRRLVGGSRA